VSTPASAESVEIVELPTRVVVGELVAAPFDRLHVEVPAAWRRFTASAAAHGIPLAETSFTTESGYVEVVGALRDVDAVAVPAGQVPVLVPAGRYARLVHTGELTQIAEGFARIYAWADAHAVTLGGRKLDVGYHAEGPHELYIDILEHGDGPSASGE
jgi:predicted transcriptional regulator YdeE